MKYIKEIYDGIKFCVKRGEDEVTDFIKNRRRIEQGCIDLVSFSYVRQYATLFSIGSLSLFHNRFRPHVAIFRCSSLDGTCCTAMPFFAFTSGF
jgi:hypothetical protein